MEYMSLLKHFFELRKNTNRTAGEIRGLQEQKLRALLHHAWDHSPYYRQRFEAAGITRAELDTKPLSAFPTIDKAALLSHFDDLVTVRDLHQEELRRFDAEKSMDEKIYLGKYHIVHSSGSTGKPGYFVYDEAAWDQMLLGIIRGALWGMSTGAILKLLLGGPRILYIAATDGRYGGAMAVGDGVDGLHAKQLHLDIKTPLRQWVTSVREFRPNIIIGYPSAVKILGELVEQGQVDVQIKRLISCGEPLSVNMRQFLEGAFQCPVVNFYGASESLALGVEMGDGDGMVLFDDMNIIEVVDGTMYLTSLYNFVQPLIRYKVSDQLTLHQPAAGDRWPFTRADTILGRDEDILWFEDQNNSRDFLHPLAIEGFCIDGLRDYQFRQISPDSFEMLCETASTEVQEPIRQEMLRQMKGILLEKGLGYVQFYVRFVDMIRPDPRTGKKKLILKETEAVENP